MSMIYVWALMSCSLAHGDKPGEFAEQCYPVSTYQTETECRTAAVDALKKLVWPVPDRCEKREVAKP